MRSGDRTRLCLYFLLLEKSVSFVSIVNIESDVKRITLLKSSIGNGPPDDAMGDFLDPSNEESDEERRAREFRIENSLPLSFDSDDFSADIDRFSDEAESSENGSLAKSSLSQDMMSEDMPETVAHNPYLAVVSKLTPSELISKFTSSAGQNVQTAVRSTILSLIGGLPKMAFDTTTRATGHKLASLMFQLQMTGYMFKNAEYKLSMEQALGVTENAVEDTFYVTEDHKRVDSLDGTIKGKLRVHSSSRRDGSIGPSNANEGIEVDAAAYLSELRAEVSQLRNELVLRQREKEDAMRKDLLAFIRTLPEQELKSLTSTMSQDVLLAMKGLVGAVIAGIGEGQIGPETVTEQSGEALAQLCMWQLAVGYNLRTLEVREEMKKNLPFGTSDESDYESLLQ